MPPTVHVIWFDSFLCDVSPLSYQLVGCSLCVPGPCRPQRFSGHRGAAEATSRRVHVADTERLETEGDVRTDGRRCWWNFCLTVVLRRSLKVWLEVWPTPGTKATKSQALPLSSILARSCSIRQLREHTTEEYVHNSVRHSVTNFTKHGDQQRRDREGQDTVDRADKQEQRETANQTQMEVFPPVVAHNYLPKATHIGSGWRLRMRTGAQTQSSILLLQEFFFFFKKKTKLRYSSMNDCFSSGPIPTQTDICVGT